MNIDNFEDIKNVNEKDNRKKYALLKDYQETIKKDFIALSNYKFFIENTNLTIYWWDSYIKTKYYLKECALQDSKIPIQLREVAFYDWLKICINPQNDLNVDFFFNNNDLDLSKKYLIKENQVKEILFENENKLRDIFSRDDWQIRLRKIRTWFLKRYDWETTWKLYLSSKDKRRNWPEFIDLLFPRLLFSILIGYNILFSNSDTWTLPLYLNFLWVILIVILVLIYGYFIYECFDAIGGEMNTKRIARRVRPIFLRGLLFSLLSSIIFYGIHSCYFISGWSCNEDIYSSLKIISFYAVIAFSIGILIQTIWEEKTVTEPL